MRIGFDAKRAMSNYTGLGNYSRDTIRILSHYFKNNHVKAKKWFEKLFDTEKTTDETLLFRYKQTLKALKLDKSPNDYVSVSVSN